MSQSPDKLFRIDPREVKVTAPISQFTAQTNTNIVDTRLATRTKQRGVQALGQAVLGLAAVKADQRLEEDIRVAEEAAAREEVMPGGLLPKAQRAYRDAIDINTSHAATLEATDYLSGEFTETIKSTKLFSRQKIDQLKITLDKYKTKALATLQNPLVIQKLNLKFNELIAKNTKIIHEFEKDQRDLNTIKAGSNTMFSATSFAKQVGGDNIWRTTFTERFLKNMATDILQISPEMKDSNEHKILAFTIMANNPDMLGKPSIMQNLLKAEYSKGITFATLLTKGNIPNRITGKIDLDAKQFLDVWTKYQQNSTAHFASIEKNNKQAKAQREKDLNEALTEYYNNGGSSSGGIELAKQFGITDIKALNIIGKQGKTYITNLKNRSLHDRYSVRGKRFEEIIKGQTLTAAEIRHHMRLQNINPSEKGYYEDLASIENTQIKEVKKAYDDSIKLVKKNRVRLLERSLGGGDFLLPDGKINARALQDKLLSKGINQKDAHKILEEITALDFEFENRVTRAASLAAKTDKLDVRQDVMKFQNDYNTEIAEFIKNIEQGILTRKEKVVGTPIVDSEKQRVNIEVSPLIKQHQSLIEDRNRFIEDERTAITKAYSSAGQKNKNKYNQSVNILNKTDTEYLENLTKNMPKESLERYSRYLNTMNPKSAERTLTGKDILSLVTIGKLQDTQKTKIKEPSKYTTGLGPVVDTIDETIGDIVNLFKDKPQIKYEIESTVNFLELFNKGLDKIESSIEDTFSDFKSNIDKTRGKDTTERLLRTPERTPMESTPPIQIEEQVIQKDLASITKKVAEEVNLDPKLLDILFKLESSGGKQLTNIPKKGEKASSAKGEGQIIDATAKSLAKRLKTTPDKIQNDTETNVRGTALLFTDALERYKDTNDPIIFAFADHHGGSTIINTARRKATNKNDIESVIQQLKKTATKKNKQTDTIEFIRKAQKELNR